MTIATAWAELAKKENAAYPRNGVQVFNSRHANNLSQSRVAGRMEHTTQNA